MAFEWKEPKKIWKGEGIYHLTFVVAGRRPLLGELVAELPDVSRPFYRNLTERVPAVNDRGELAMIRLSPFGRAVSNDLNALEERYKESITICRKMILDDHFHIVLWVRKDIGKSILQVAHGIRQGITHIAQDMGVWPRQVGMNDACDASQALPYHIMEKPFTRTLSRAGQLDAMCDYVVLNAYRKYMKRQTPALFTMHKDTEVKSLHFRSMGNHWLLDWPERQMVECSRAINDDDLQAQLHHCLQHAATGAVTYTCAISKGEQFIARSIREAGYPVVILMLDGFPPAGSDNERFFKPGGVYFDACNSGKLLLLEAHESTYSNSLVTALTDADIQRKAQAKGHHYTPIPHDTKRWRMIAGNVMLHLITNP